MGKQTQYFVPWRIKTILERRDLFSKLSVHDSVSIVDAIGYELPKIGGIVDFYFSNLYGPNGLEKDIDPTSIFQQERRIITISDIASKVPSFWTAVLSLRHPDEKEDCWIDDAVLLYFNEEGKIGFGDDKPFHLCPDAKLERSFNRLNTSRRANFEPVFERMLDIYQRLAEGH